MEYGMDPNCRSNIYVDAARKIIIVRPIGPLSASEFIAEVFRACAKIEAPWEYSRLNDFRRLETTFTEDEVQEMAARWAEITQGHSYPTRVAIVRLDAWNEARLPNFSPLFPNDTLCAFTDYHEAMGWLIAADPSTYLAHIRSNPVERPDDFSIQVN
jgi:hypothetical protein